MTLSEILQAQNGFNQNGQQQNSAGNFMNGFQGGLNFADALKKAGIFGGAGATEAAVVPPVIPPVV